MFDLVFKSLFQNKDFRKTLSYFLSILTKYSESYIYENLRFLNAEIPIENYDEKKKIADLIIKIDEDIINIEANRNNNKSKILKNNSYHHKLAYEKNHVGQDLNEDKYTIGLYDKAEMNAWMNKIDRE